MELWLCTHADPTQPPSVTNPSTYLAAEDLSVVYPFTSCVRVDSLSGATKKLSVALKVARWLKNLELP